LILHGKSATSFKRIPGNDLTQRVLKIKKEHQDLAANISSKLNLKISEQKLSEMDEES
jgi:hypothetical protein